MRFFKFWKRKKSDTPINRKPIAELGVTIYPDRVECTLYGDEIKIGGALVTLMLNNQYSHKIITNSVIATEKELDRQKAFAELMTINLN